MNWANYSSKCESFCRGRVSDSALLSSSPALPASALYRNRKLRFYQNELHRVRGVNLEALLRTEGDSEPAYPLRPPARFLPARSDGEMVAVYFCLLFESSENPYPLFCNYLSLKSYETTVGPNYTRNAAERALRKSGAACFPRPIPGLTPIGRSGRCGQHRPSRPIPGGGPGTVRTCSPTGAGEVLWLAGARRRVT